MAHKCVVWLNREEGVVAVVLFMPDSVREALEHHDWAAWHATLGFIENTVREAGV